MATEQITEYVLTHPHATRCVRIVNHQYRIRTDYMWEVSR